jgi:hypothetical protein
MGKRRTSEADLEVPSMTARVLELSAAHWAWPEGPGASVVVKKGRARRPAEKIESAGDAGTESVQHRKRSTQPSAEVARRRSPARSDGVKREREESGARKPKTSPTAAEGVDGGDTASMGKRTSARNGRARGSATARKPSAARAKDCCEAERSAVAEDERRAGDPSQVQVLEPAEGVCPDRQESESLVQPDRVLAGPARQRFTLRVVSGHPKPRGIPSLELYEDVIADGSRTRIGAELGIDEEEWSRVR